jgi:hypothetical protein
VVRRALRLCSAALRFSRSASVFSRRASSVSIILVTLRRIPTLGFDCHALTNPFTGTSQPNRSAWRSLLWLGCTCTAVPGMKRIKTTL